MYPNKFAESPFLDRLNLRLDEKRAELARTENADLRTQIAAEIEELEECWLDWDE